jgi:beta-galactosidase
MILLPIAAAVSAEDASPRRNVIVLDGEWQIAEGGMDPIPKDFARTVVVPGLVDMAQPAFAEVGRKGDLRAAFWYRRTFKLDGAVPAVAILKIHKAKYGTKVYLNGHLVGEHLPCFTPALLDVQRYLKGGGQSNELVIRVGADRQSLPEGMPNGWDYEKKRYFPGIYDSVELILTGSPHIARVQAVPNIDTKSVGVHVWLRHASVPNAASVHFTVREWSSGRIVGKADCQVAAVGSGGERQGAADIAIADCRLWSPEDPFLYELEARGEADTLKTRFGMRTFRLDPATRRAVLNGRPYFMRGTNVATYRFFEDSERGEKPWREEWVRRLHKAFREMHWNSLRYAIGFPPESWYRIADEEGLLVQDEFPLWNQGNGEPKFKDSGELAAEYTEWMQERWNHPCVVIWDACNETNLPQTGDAIRTVRGLDLSHRPWDNGWTLPSEPGDAYESHPYHFNEPSYRLRDLARESGSPTARRPGNIAGPSGNHAIIVNEYGWLWLNRDGTPTTLTRDLYRNLLGPNSSVAQRRHLYARYLAAETEFWRCRRDCAAVMHFAALAYSLPDGQTSDHWMDLERLTWEPEFYRYVRDAFAPTGLMIDAWAEEYPPGRARRFPVIVVNDRYQPWSGTVRFRLLRQGTIIEQKNQPCVVPSLGTQTVTFAIYIPDHPALYQAEAALLGIAAQPVRSVRDFRVSAGADAKAAADAE